MSFLTYCTFSVSFYESLLSSTRYLHWKVKNSYLKTNTIRMSKIRRVCPDIDAFTLRLHSVKQICLVSYRIGAWPRKRVGRTKLRGVRDWSHLALYSHSQANFDALPFCLSLSLSLVRERASARARRIVTFLEFWPSLSHSPLGSPRHPHANLKISITLAYFVHIFRIVDRSINS